MEITKNSEQHLISELNSGSRHAFDEIYWLYFEDLYLFACKATRSSEDAEEIIQDLFVDIWLKKQSLHIRESLRAYLFTALKYKIIDIIRKQKRFEQYTAFILEDFSSVCHNTPEKTLISAEEQQRILKSLNILPEKCRQIFYLKKVDRYTVSEIANHLSISNQTVKNQIVKATKTMEMHRHEIAVATLFSLLHF